MIFLSSARLTACFFTSFARLVSRLTMEVFAMCVSSVAERKAEGFEQRLGFRVRLCGGGDGDIHAAHCVDLVEIDLREDDLLLDRKSTRLNSSHVKISY